MNKKKYVIHQQPIPYMLVKNYFDATDIELMLKELRFLTPKMEFRDGTNLPTKDHKKNVQINYVHAVTTAGADIISCLLTNV